MWCYPKLRFRKKAVYLIHTAQHHNTSGVRIMDDKRKVDRRFLLYYMRVYDEATRQQIGNLVDITPAGIMVVGEHPLREGQTTRLRVDVTEAESDTPLLEFAARSQW